MTNARSRWPAPPGLPESPWPYVAVLGVVCVLVALPYLREGYVFFLDQSVGPAWHPFAARVSGGRDPAYGGSLPLYAVLGVVVALAGPMVAQKVFLCGVVAAVAVAGYRTLPGPRWARLYGALLLLVNPFVYARALAGQWLVVWGVAALPVAFAATARYLDRGSRRGLAVAVAAVTLLGFDAHALYAAVIPLGALVLVKASRGDARRVLTRAAGVCLVALPVNAYWLGPALFARDGPFAHTGPDLVAFAPRVDAVSALFTAASLRGFWRAGYVGATDLLPVVRVLAVPVLFLAVYGAVTHYDDGRHGDAVLALAATAVVAVPLAAGLRGPAAPAFRWLADAVPFFAGMRDSNKFVLLLVVAYAYLGALGVARLVERVRTLDRGQWAAIGACAFTVALPLVYSFPMVTGDAGQVHATDYPRDWYQTNRLLDADPAPGRVLFLPWHRYADYSWVGNGRWRVSTPARQFFSRPVVQADGTADATSRTVEDALGLGADGTPDPAEDVGARLAAADVRYVVLAKDADWRAYAGTLRGRPALTLVRDSRHLVVYRVDAPGSPVSPSAREHATFDPISVSSYAVSLLSAAAFAGYVLARRLESAADASGPRGGGRSASAGRGDRGD